MKRIFNFKQIKNGPRQLIVIALICAFGLAALTRLTDFTRSTQALSYAQFMKQVEADQVKSVYLSGQEGYGVLKESGRFEVTLPAEDPKLLEILRQHNVDISIAPQGAQFNPWYLILFALGLGALALAWFVLKQSKGGSGSQGIFSMGKSKARMFLPSQIKTTFADVAGAQEAKQELQDIVEFLKNPQKFHKLGARLPKGILLVGEPGNGKTLLAKAVAGEAEVPFFSISGSDFIEIFVGVGSVRIKDLFAQARKHAPCIIFIDEIDAIGRQRGIGLGGGNDEREQTLNQLLIEMDGFEESEEPVIVLAATNIPDVLDKALLRPGRFDRRIEVPFPDEKGRLDILKIHMGKVVVSPDIDLQEIAAKTAGFSGADLENLVNQAALSASKSGRSMVVREDIDRAFEKLMSSQETSHMHQGSGQRGASKARMYMPSQVRTTFADVAGAVEAKEELSDVVDFLKNPAKYQHIGAQLTKGVLLVGDPGNGKTLLAKAVAGEAQVPFFSVSGSEFIEEFVGVGAARVRDLFAQARKHSPCIVFIDEIDSIGRKRRSGGSGGDSEYDQTLNQLLVEMDGFDSTKSSVIILAATNRVDILDKALLRPGRFDRQVHVPYPDMVSREKILAVHAKRVKIDPEIDLHKIARGTPGFTGASLAHLINEAAINAVKHGRMAISLDDIDEARDKIILGKESSIVMTPEELKVTAFHEAGHALVRLMMPEDTDPLYKITIIPRGSALGVTHYMPERDKYMETKEQLIANVMAALGGRAAEELVFGKLSTGASSDFQAATGIVRRMVCQYGMTEELGPVVYGQDAYGSPEYSQETARKIDHEIKRILEQSYRDALELLRKNREKLDLLSLTLLEKETLFAEEIYPLLGLEPRSTHSIR